MARPQAPADISRKMQAADDRILAAMYHDPAYFAYTWFDRTILPHQLGILESLRDHRKTAVRSGNGPGKDFTAAVAAIWWLWTHPDSIVVTTAPTWRQVSTILWREINALVATARRRNIQLPSGRTIGTFGPEPLATEWRIDDKWFAIGVSTKKPEHFQGLHAPYVLVILDEASGIEDQIFKTAVRSLAIGPNDRILAIGNPTQNEGLFYEIFNIDQTGASWHQIHIDSMKLPWIVAGNEPPFPGLVSLRWIREMLEEHDEDSPAFQIHVRGNFSATADNLLLTLAQAQRATESEGCETGNPVVLGVDVGEYGSNETALVRLSGGVMTDLKTYQGLDTMEVVGRVAEDVSQEPVDLIVVDAIGVGSGVLSRLKELKYPAVGFYGGAVANDSDQYVNLRAEAYYTLAREIKKENILLQDDHRLMMQLAYLPYKTKSVGIANGKIILVSKEELRKKGKRSPDRADALMMARWGQWQLVAADEGDDMIVMQGRRR